MTTLPVREMVLYKHGVGFFVREGEINAEEIALTFHQDEINDVLKSLAVFDRAGGQVLGIHYQTPMDRMTRLANSSIRLSTKASLRDLLRDLRGRQVMLTLETTPGTLESITGRVIGLDEPEKAGIDLDPINASIFSLLADDGQVRIFRLDTLRAISIQNSQSEHDLTYFLDTSIGEDTRRVVNVRLSEGDHQLVVYYVAPSPTWRVSYRIVAESDKDKETGKALLQGWGLFDNRLEEDLENVSVTLVAGQPISFIYELYASRIPHRPTVQDQSRIAPGPVEFEAFGEFNEHEPADLLAAMKPTAAKAAAPAAPTPAASRQPITKLTNRPDLFSGEHAKQAAPPAAEAKETGEFFQYVVTTPVSVKRGESALVPIIGSEVSYDRELLYNGAKLPNHPVAALRFMNTTGLTLERGPVTVVENGDYKGEAVVAFTKDGNQVYLPYAVELGVRVVEHFDQRTETAGLTIQGVYLQYEEYQIQTMSYVIDNTTAKPLTITIEAPIRPKHELFETPQPAVETATERRWRVDVSARKKTEFVRQERIRTWRKQELRQLDYQNLQTFLENRWLDRQTYEQLADMLDALAFVQRARAEQDMLTNERKKIYESQEQLRANLTTLQSTGQEAGLRKRMLDQLEGTQNRLDEIEQRIKDLAQQITSAEQRTTEIIRGLS